ncbi:MAG: GGDEF domain-containing protein [Lachnospiraceae bacterium]|nr:GGDEF domain-containing protein [Lachnospiraceae bacterium]
MALPERRKQDLLDFIIDTVFINDKETFIYNRISALITKYVSLILNVVLDPDANDFPIETLKDIAKEYIKSDIPLYYSIVQLNYCFHTIEKLVLSLITDESKKVAFCIASNAVSMQLLSAESSFRYNEKHEYKLNIWTSSYIIRDTMTNSNNVELVYNQMGDKMQRLDMISSYIYTMPSDAVHLDSDGTWHIPEQLQLQVYNKDQVTVPLTKAEYLVSVKDLFRNPYMPQKRRYTMVVTPIFTSEVHHGLFVCEVDIAYFHHIYSISLELGTTLKFLKMYDEQQQTNQQLEYTLSVLHEKNRQLSKISTIDELTGLKNRRGFLTETQTVISSSINKGQHAILLFADMDNLKMVNDMFGHEDGDFALRTIATALKTSLRGNDIIGRIGGDEFVAFAILGSQQSADTLSNRIRNKLEIMNRNCDKPYYIEASIGIVDFVCEETLDIQSLIKKADDALYENKSHKRRSVLKES